MKLGQSSSIAFVSAVLLTAAACGGAKPDATAQQTPAASPQNAAQAAQQMADSLKQLGQNQTAKAVDFEKLVSFLPEPSGWTRSKPKGEQVSMGVSISKADAEYTKGEGSIKLEITDTSFSQMLMAPLSMMLMSNYSERNSEGYKKYAALGGQPGFETWQNGPKEGEVTVVIANRFIVNARGTNVDNIDAVRSLVQAVDLKKLADLK